MQSMFENLYPEVASCIALRDDVHWAERCFWLWIYRLWDQITLNSRGAWLITLFAYFITQRTTISYCTINFDPANSSSLLCQITFKLWEYFSRHTVHFISFGCEQINVSSFTYLIKAFFLLLYLQREALKCTLLCTYLSFSSIKLITLLYRVFMSA